MSSDQDQGQDQGEEGCGSFLYARGLEPQFPIQFLYFDDGFYHYSSHCCMADDHFGYIVSKEELPLTNCRDNPTTGYEEQIIDIDGNSAGTNYPKFLPRIYVTAQSDVGKRAVSIDITKAYQGNGNALVTAVLGMGNVEFTGLRGDAFDKIKGKSYTLRHVFSAYVGGEQDDRQRFQSFVIADRCRVRETTNCVALEITKILPDGITTADTQNIFFAELKTPIDGLQHVLIVAKNP